MTKRKDIVEKWRDSLKKWFRQSVKDQLFRDARLTFFFKAGGTLAGFLNYYLTVIHFNLTAQGIVALVFSALAIIQGISLWGTELNILRSISKNNSRQDKALISLDYLKGFRTIIITLAVFFTGILLFSAECSVYLFGTDDRFWPTLFIALSMTPACLLVLNSEYARGYQQMLPYNIFAFSTGLLTSILLGSYIILSSDRGIETPLFIQLSAVWLLFAASQWHVTRHLRINLRVLFSIAKSSTKHDGVFYLAFMGVFRVINDRSDIMIIALFVSSPVIAMYFLISRMSSLLQLIGQSVYTPGIPELLRLFYQGNREALVRYKNKMVLLSSSLSLGAMIILIAIHKPVLELFSSWEKETGTGLMIMSSAYLLSIICGPSNSYLMLSGGEKANFYINMTATLLFVTLCFLWIPEKGIVGAAMARLTRTIAVNAVTLFIIYRKQGILMFYFPEGKTGLNGSQGHSGSSITMDQ